MRVVMVDDTSLYTNRLLDGLRENGVDCIHYAPASPPRGKLRQIMEQVGPYGVRVWNQFLFPFQILKRTTKDKPNIVHLQFEFYGTYSYGPLYSAFGVSFCLFLLRIFGFKTIVTVHAVLRRGASLRIIRDTSPSSKQVPAILLDAFLILTYRIISNFSSMVIVHAEVFKNRLVQQYGLKPSKVMVVPHGVEATQSSAKNSQALTDARQSMILYFGVISPRKGLECLLSAFALLAKRSRNCSLWLLGASPPYYHEYEVKLKEFANKLALGSRVRFLGWVEAELAHSLFREALFIVLPYSYDVSASGVLGWALSHGLPVIVSETEYFTEELSRFKFGLSVPPGNPQALSKVMETLIEQEGLRASLSEEARKMSQSRSWGSVARTMLGVYQDLL